MLQTKILSAFIQEHSLFCFCFFRSTIRIVCVYEKCTRVIALHNKNITFHGSWYTIRISYDDNCVRLGSSHQRPRTQKKNYLVIKMK